MASISMGVQFTIYFGNFNVKVEFIYMSGTDRLVIYLSFKNLNLKQMLWLWLCKL